MDRKHHRHRLHVLTRVQEWLSSFFRILSYGPIVSLMFGVAFLPVIYMGGEAWWLPLELIIVLVGFFCWGLSYWWRGYRAGHFSVSLTVLLFALPLVVAIFQCIPSDRLTSFLSPGAYTLFDDFNALGIAVAKHSISVAPDRTYRYVMLLLVALLFHLLAYSHCTERMKMRLMLLAIVLAALGNAGLSFYETLMTGSKSALNLPVFKGAFLNRNHFGFLMMLGIMSDLGLLAGITLDEKHSHRRRQSINTGDEYEWKGWRILVLPLGLVLFLLLVALLMSFSRGAFIGTVVSMLMFGIIWFTKRREAEKGNSQIILAIMALVAVALIGSVPYVMDSLSKRFSDMFEKDLSMDARCLVWKDSLKLIADYKLAGVGLGCFKDTIQPYESGNINNELIEHAHNDYLELSAELGLPVAIILLISIAAFLFVVFCRCWKVHDPTYKWCCFALMSAMVGVAIHEFVDYNLHAYPNFLIFAVMLSLLSICVHRRGKSMEEITGMTHSELHELNRKRRYGIRLPLLPITLLLMAVILPFCLRLFQTSVARNTLRMECESEMSQFAPRPVGYKRRIALANAVLAKYPNDQKTLMYKSSSELGLAMHQSIKREQAVALIGDACKDISLACSRAPGDGNAALMCAQLFSMANSMMARADSLEQQLKLYDWADSRYPKIIMMKEAVASFASQAYLAARVVEPERSEEFKKYALSKTMELVELRPKTFRRIYTLLPVLVDGYDKLIDVAPDTIPARKELMDFLMEMREYDNAMMVAEGFLEKLDSEQLASEQELANYRLYALSLQNLIYELKNEADKRAENWPRMLAAIEECEKLKNKGKDGASIRGKKNEFRVKYSEYMPQYYLDKAINARNLGRINDVVHYLLPITYILDKGKDGETYGKALELLSGWETYFDESIEVRANYLENVLRILASEAGESNDTMKNVQALEALERKVSKQNSVQWLQRHLIPLYIGRGYELQGEKAKAVSAYRRCLNICGLNYMALSGIERCTDGSADDFTNQERRVLDVIRSRKTPIAYLENGLVWQAMETTPAIVEKAGGMVSSEFMFICRRDMKAALSWSMRFQDKRGTLFPIRISFPADEAMLWRIGQIILVRKEYNPYSEAMKASHRLIAPGDIMMGADVTSIPNTLLKAFEFGGFKDNGKSR